MHCSKRIDRSYESVRLLLRDRPDELLKKATTSAAARVESLIARLHVPIAGLEVGVDVRMFVGRIREQQAGSDGLPSTRVELSWNATTVPLLPAMQAELTATRVAINETLLEIDGNYWLPLGALGRAIDAAVGHRIAEAAIHGLLADVAAEIREESAYPDSAARGARAD